MERQFKNPDDAFELAIQRGVLSNEPSSPVYAGAWMYMWSDDMGDHFKHIRTRQYIISKGE